MERTGERVRRHGSPLTRRFRAKAANPLPPGTVAVALGVATSSLTNYGLLAISARALGPSRYAPVAVLWTLVTLVATGFFLPFEQELGRLLAGRRSHRREGTATVLRVAGAGGAVAVVLVLVTLATARPIVDGMFDGEVLLLVALEVALVGFLGHFLARGAFAGTSRFGSYGALLVVDGLLRVVVCATLAIARVGSPGMYGLAIGTSSGVATVTVLVWCAGRRRWSRSIAEAAAPPVPAVPSWSALGSALTLLLAGSLLAQFLVSVAPLAVQLLSSRSDPGLAGRFLNSLIVARIPLFMFQAVQASLLPALARHAAAGRMDEFRRGLTRLLVLVAGIAVASTLACTLWGPLAVRVLFGPGFMLRPLDFALLAAGSGAYMLALPLALALIALSGHLAAALGWLVGTLCFIVVASLGSGVLLRVEVSLLAASLAAALVMGALVPGHLRAAQRRAVAGPAGGCDERAA